MYSIGGEVEESRGLVSCERGDIDGDGKKTIDKASPSRFKSKIRIWESERPQTDRAMVDVLESGKDTEGGFSNIHTKARKEGGTRGDKE